MEWGKKMVVVVVVYVKGIYNRKYKDINFKKNNNTFI